MLLVRSFDEGSFLEDRAGADEGDEMRAVDRPPPLFGRLDELEGHRESRGSGAGALGHPCPQSHRRERRFDWVGNRYERRRRQLIPTTERLAGAGAVGQYGATVRERGVWGNAERAGRSIR